MFVGKMLMALDEAGGILSMRYCKGLVMTACVDAMDFYYADLHARGRRRSRRASTTSEPSSLEVGVKVLAEVPWSGEVRHACTAFLTYVHLGPDLRPRPRPAVHARHRGRPGAGGEAALVGGRTDSSA